MKTITTILFLSLFLNSFAQWVENTDVNTLVVDSRGEDMQAIGTSDGKTYVVFWKVVPPPQNYELRVQLLGADGTKIFGSDGILVSDAIPMSTFTVIWSITIDEEDNLYIGATGTQNFDAFVFKMNTLGNHLWGTQGVQIGNGNVVKILPLSSGEAIVSWFPAPQSLLQKLDANGNTLWTSPVPVVNGSNSTVPAEMFEMTNGDFTLVFHNVLSGINSFLYAQRYDNSGNSVWTTPTQMANRATAFNRTYSKAQDSDVVYMGYFASAGVRFDSYLQRLNPDGTLPWGINGSDFDINETDYEMETSIAFDGSSPNIWSVCTYSDTSQNLRGEYIQKFDKETGARLFTDNAKQIYALSSSPNVHAGKLQLQSNNPFFLIKSGLDNGVSPVTLLVTLLNQNGDFAWENETELIATFPANKSRIQFTKPVNLQSVAVFIEQKATDTEPKIYAQNFIDQLLSVSEIAKNNIFFNNPVKEILTINGLDVFQRITIYEVTGKLVLDVEVNNLTEINIPTSLWKNGVYFMKMGMTSGQKKQFKLLK
ncbi:MAG: hypothetical protein COZ75_10310 [Flavobacteriaceae bacterium CG_4_8_14_3_um_filter_34_10]|nr:MAG: hypothetical protein COW66_06015 [Flavobacteriaceae bacterium CG18_big_fil_WC_8_21_14_2_50_34_36]PIV49818.1 MAG: hypothetical protein COS19_06580 [Flavobacteriaceae bacterium CG02_land_8_20_14_3_00_34_13]PIX08775.1 MAG: hypothetical protein COZ75_10310 [Flavobacteriaceae bacterium CG_4_8_14_3_um_filter_34_10]PIZ07092.1 MAG: hypothetical protein COY56_10870 [Flavobacteriaceae bacterium CG_4_10_14_0_8_um_filter_34_31]PJC06063.1 MAG: hypothetical protein CO068_13195 [Flavobacteriaceae bact